MKQTNKSAYAAPIVEVIEMENEGVIASSVETGVTSPSLGGGTQLQTNGYYNSPASSELEDLIDDILTIEQ